MLFRYKKAYLKKFDSFKPAEKELVISADRQIRHYYVARVSPYGLRIKKLYSDNSANIFEARVSDKIRIIWVHSGSLVSFAFLGSYDEAKRYIKSI